MTPNPSSRLDPWTASGNPGGIQSKLLRFAQAKVEKGLSPKTVRNTLSILRRVLNLAQREGRVSRNPAAPIGELMRRVDRRVASEVVEVESWSRSEVETLLHLAQEHEPVFYPALLFLLSTGVRRGELLGLKWSDVDFDRREISIRQAITVRQVTTPKSGRSRVIRMPESLASALFDLLAQTRKEMLSRGWPQIPEWVFCSKAGTPLEERNLNRLWYRLRRRAQKQGVRPLKLHATRHTWATFALHAGKSVRWVAAQLGHADPALTLRTYTPTRFARRKPTFPSPNSAAPDAPCGP
jgi:integrase